MAGVVDVTTMVIFGTCMATAPLRGLLRTVLPKPGQGPSAEEQLQGYLRVTAHGTGTQGAASHRR
jgi:short subunit dehydrogenase-like uncharacterized protein